MLNDQIDSVGRSVSSFRWLEKFSADLRSSISNLAVFLFDFGTGQCSVDEFFIDRIKIARVNTRPTWKGLFVTLEQRIEKLETELSRSHLRNRFLVGGLLLCLGGTALSWVLTPSLLQAQARSSPLKEYRANRFVLEDRDGKNRAELSMYKDGPRLVLTDDKGVVRAGLSVLPDGPGLGLFDEKGDSRGVFAYLKGQPMLAVFDPKGKPRITVTVSDDGPGLKVLDDAGKVRVGLGATSTKTVDGRTINHPESSLILYDAEGAVRWTTP